MATPRVWLARMNYHSDDRRMFYGDIFATPDGDINVVYLKPHVPIAWHRHQRQVDRIFLVQGSLRLRVWSYDPQGDMVEHILIDTPGTRRVLHVPIGSWHGYEALTENTIVLQFNGPGKWDGSDEERLSLKDVAWTPTR